MPAKEYNEMRMRGILPSDGMDAIPVTEGSPITEINSRLWVWDSVGVDWVKSKGNAAGELTVNFATPIGVTETAPLTSIQVEPKPNATAIPVGKIPDGGAQITKDNVIDNGTVTIHQVTNGTTFYVDIITISIINLAAAGDSAMLQVTNSLDVPQYNLLVPYCPAADGKSAVIPFSTPLEVPSTWKIRIYSPIANYHVRGFVHGYEI